MNDYSSQKKFSRFLSYLAAFVLGTYVMRTYEMHETIAMSRWFIATFFGFIFYLDSIIKAKQ